jgi:Zn-dependent M16 (insulinase) family peptidase
MHVYLDAVFYPNIYDRKEIFWQEGWHYDLKEMDQPITYNGVVYNEMKGAFSSAEEVLDREVFNSLFPDTAYGVESGGDPEFIPDLTYEDFLDFHRKYYHPSNSYIYLYGKMDMISKLTWLDAMYLSKFDKIHVDSAIGLQKSFSQSVEKTMYYPIAENEPEEQNTYLSYNVVVGDSLDMQTNMAFQVWEYVLTAAPGAPVKQALLDEKIGKDIQSSYENGIRQPFFSIVAKNADEADKEWFVARIKETLQELVKKGLDKKALLAGINYFEFRFREADYASFPKGLMYGVSVFDSWLYDDGEPFMYLRQLDVFAFLKEQVQGNYYEELIRRYFLENAHEVLLVGAPQKGLTAKREAEIGLKLAQYKEKLSSSECQELIRQTKALEVYQEEPETPEAIASIPLLARKDIKKKAAALHNQERMVSNTQVIHHALDTNGIAYMTLLFDTKHVPREFIPYMGILKSVLGYVDTNHYSYNELFNEINANSGGIYCGMSVYENIHNEQSCLGMFGVKSKCLYSQLPFVVQMIQEIICGSKFQDTKRLYEIVAQIKSRMESNMASSGHATAVARLASYHLKTGWLQEQIAGVDYFKLIQKLEKHFDQEKAELCAKLVALVKMIFRPENLCISYTADEEGYDLLCTQIPKIHEMLYTDAVQTSGFEIQLEKKNEGLKTAGQVQYVGVGGNFKQKGYAYTGALKILRVIMNYDYLWMNIRVKGGAYGSMCGFKRSGESYMVSYRDPNLEKTLDVYAKAADFIRSFQADERQMTKYIIGTVSDLDTPQTPSVQGEMSMTAYFTGVTEEQLQRERDQILEATVEDIRKLADVMACVLEQDYLCVIGNETIIEENRDKFIQVGHLIG